jgi:hypothetical protein
LSDLWRFQLPEEFIFFESVYVWNSKDQVARMQIWFP